MKKIAVLGGGQVGSSVAKILTDDGNDITLVDSNASVLEALQDDNDIKTIQGNASSPSVLKQAEIEDCDILIATTANDEVNLVSCHLAKNLFNVPNTLSRNLTRKQAMEMLLTGDFIDAQTACERGLVNRVAPMERLDGEVAALCRSILAKPAAAVAAGKGLFYRQAETGIEAAYQMAGQTMACNMMDACALEGVQAFIEKRPPEWTNPKD